MRYQLQFGLAAACLAMLVASHGCVAPESPDDEEPTQQVSDTSTDQPDPGDEPELSEPIAQGQSDDDEPELSEPIAQSQPDDEQPDEPELSEPIAQGQPDDEQPDEPELSDPIDEDEPDTQPDDGRPDDSPPADPPEAAESDDSQEQTRRGSPRRDRRTPPPGAERPLQRPHSGPVEEIATVGVPNPVQMSPPPDVDAPPPKSEQRDEPGDEAQPVGEDDADDDQRPALESGHPLEDCVDDAAAPGFQCSADLIIDAIDDGHPITIVEHCEVTDDPVGCGVEVHRQLFDMVPPAGERDPMLLVELAVVQKYAGADCDWVSRLAATQLLEQAVQKDDQLLSVITDLFDDWLRGIPDYHRLVGELDVDTWEGIEEFLTSTRFFRMTDRSRDAANTSWLQFHDDGTYRARLRTREARASYDPDEDFRQVSGSWQLVSAEPGQAPEIRIDGEEMHITDSTVFILQPPGDNRDGPDRVTLDEWDLYDFPGDTECVLPP